MKYKVTTKVSFSPDKTFKLESQESLRSPQGLGVNLRSDDDKRLVVEMTLDAEDLASAEEMAREEIFRTSSLLSYHYDVRIAQTWTVSCVEVDAQGKEKTGRRLYGSEMTFTPRGTDVIIGQVGVAELGRLLSRKHRKRFNELTFDDAVQMWSEARSQESEAMQYLLLYRLMECLFKGKGKEVTIALTEWICTKEPKVHLCPPDKWRTYNITVYTHLRDNIHWKRSRYPSAAMTKHLPRLRNLVRQRIDEIWPAVAKASHPLRQ